jgi:hypothetical protein
MYPCAQSRGSGSDTQSSVASTTTQPYLEDCISVSTPYLLLYLVGRAGKMKKVAKVQVDPVGGSFEGNPIPPLYACVQVQHLLHQATRIIR